MSIQIVVFRRPRLTRWVGGLAAVLLVSGSAHALDSTSIEVARQALETARSARVVRAYAKAQLETAEIAFERAEAASTHDRKDESKHLAYLAQRRAAIAQMHAKERKIARELGALSATLALIQEARALEVAAANQRARQLAQRLKRFDVYTDDNRLVLTAHTPLFASELALTKPGLRAMSEAADLLGQLSQRKVVVLGYGAGAAQDDVPANAAAKSTHSAQALQALASATPRPAASEAELVCARAEVIRALLISNGVDPRRIAATCLKSDSAPLATSHPNVDPAGETVIAILPLGVSELHAAADLARDSLPTP